MSEARLQELLRTAPVPAAEDAEARGLRIVDQAFSQRQPARRDGRIQLSITAGLAALLAALMLSPAGAAVRDWVGDVFTAGVPDARPGLSDIPGGGRLLVQSADGPWVVQPDGSRRLLGRYHEATWSPRGLFVAAVQGDTLSALEPDGTPRWSLSSEAVVSEPRWSPSRIEIAYRAGDALRVVGGDGSEDRAIALRTAPVPPVWSPRGLPLLAYVGEGRRLSLATTTGAGTIDSAKALPRIHTLEWAGRSALLEASRTSLRLRDIRLDKLAVEIGPGRRLPVPAQSTVRDAALSPDGGTVAVLLNRGISGAPRSAVVLIDVRNDSVRWLFGSPGRLGELAWSPHGRRLLVSWPEADQWLFFSIGGRGRVRAVGEVAGEFSPGSGGDAPFPRIAGWCCRR